MEAKYRGYYKNTEKVYVVTDTADGEPIMVFRDEYEAEDFSDEYYIQTGRDSIVYPSKLV